MTLTDSNFHARWARLTPPLRPNAQVVEAMRRAIAHHSSRVLLLGVTPELAVLGDTMAAVDISQEMITMAWPGDTATRLAVCGNWLRMPLHRREFTAVIGDGSFSFLPLQAYARLFAQLDPLMLRGASFAIRCYETPDGCESITQVRSEVMNGSGMGFHAFKWRLAMAMAAQAGDASVAVRSIHALFERLFQDRDALSAASGWSLQKIAEIDDYAGQDSVFSFPTRREILAAIPVTFQNPRFLESGTYELAERCPILVADYLG